MQSTTLLASVFSALVAMGALTSSPAVAEDRVFDKTFAATPGGTLVVDTDTGSISVTGIDAKDGAAQVIVHVVLRGGRAPVEHFQLTAEASDGGVNVRGRRDPANWFPLGWLLGGGMDVDYTIQVPREYHVQVRTSGGNLELKNFSGKAVARTSGGNVRVSALNGDTEVRTSGGNIRAMQIIGNTKLITSGGNIVADNARGDLSVYTSGGDIRLQAIDGELKADTSGGDVEVALTGNNRGVDVHTSGGDIVVRVPREFQATVDARTSGGDVECDLPVTSTGKHKRQLLHGEINGGGLPLRARTSGGDIRITLADK